MHRIKATRRSLPITPFLAAALLLVMAGCGGDGRSAEQQNAEADSVRQAALPVLAGSVLIDSLRVDLTGDGVSELVVVSRAEDGVDDPLLIDRFDRLDVYEQGTGGYRRLYVDAIDYGLSLASEDVTGDGVADLIVRLDAGGNNPIATQGLHVYGRDSRGAVVLLFHSPSGAPALLDLDGDGRQEILVSDQFWGMMAHSDVIGFTREVYAFGGDSYELANTTYSKWFDTMLERHKRSYEQARRAADSEEGRTRLYLRAAEYLVWNLSRGGAEQVNSVWFAERSFLRQRLGDEQYNDLEAFVEDVNAEESEQTIRRIS
jgi:hypothetical protein